MFFKLLILSNAYSGQKSKILQLTRIIRNSIINNDVNIRRSFFGYCFFIKLFFLNSNYLIIHILQFVGDRKFM